MGSCKTRSRLLSCFGCGLSASPSRAGSDVTAAKRLIEPSIGSAIRSVICRMTAADGANGPPQGASPQLCGLPPAGSARRPSCAFTEPDAVDSALLAKSLSKGKEGASPTTLTAGEGSGTGTRGISSSGGAALPEGSGPRRPARKPRARTSRVSPAYDTEDELSPAAASLSPSSSSSGRSSQSVTTRYSSTRDPPAEQLPLRSSDGGANMEMTTALQNCGSGRRGGTGDDSGGCENDPPSGGTGAVRKSLSLNPSLSAPMAAAAAAVGGGSAPGSDPQSNAPSPPPAGLPLTAAALSCYGAAGGLCSRSTSAGTCRSGSEAERPGSSRCSGGGGRDTSAGQVSEQDSARAAFAPRRASCADADVGGTIVVPGQLGDDEDDDVPYAAGCGGGGSAARRGSFSGDSSTSLVGPSTVSTTPLLRPCPSLRPTPGSPTPGSPTPGPPTPGSPTPGPKVHSGPQQLQFAPCESLRLTPLPAPPRTLQTCESLTLAPPLPPPRLMSPSPSLRPAPLLLPSPSLPHPPRPSLPQHDELLHLLLPGGQAASEPPPPPPGAGAHSGATMLRLPPPLHPSTLQHSPCSLTRGAFPRANTLAPLTHGSVPAGDNVAALDRLASLQAAFRAHGQRQMQPPPLTEPSSEPQGNDGGCTAKAADAPSAMRPTAVTCSPKPDQNQLQPWGADGPGSRASSLKALAAASGAVAKSPEGAVARSGHGCEDDGEYDKYDSGSFCDDDEDVEGMVGQLLAPTPSLRSSAPAGLQLGARIKEQLHRTASLEQPLLREDAESVALQPPRTAVAEGRSEQEASEEVHAASWLDALLPLWPDSSPQRPNGPGGRSGRSQLPAAARPKPQALPAPDSFKRLMREIE